MTCDRELLLTRSLDDPELIAHLRRCEACRTEAGELRAVLDPFHAELSRTPDFPLPTTPSRRSFMPQILVAAATLAVIGLAATQAPTRPAPETPAGLQAHTALDLKLLERVEGLSWAEVNEDQWLELAVQLERDARQVVASGDTRPEALRVLLQTGRAAENANLDRPPFWGRVDGKTYNLYYLEAAKVVKRRPELRETIEDDDLGTAVDAYLDRLAR